MKYKAGDIIENKDKNLFYVWDGQWLVLQANNENLIIANLVGHKHSDGIYDKYPEGKLYTIYKRDFCYILKK